MSNFWLDARMAELDMGDKELADALGMARSSIATWRMKKEVPSIILGNPHKIKELANALQMTPLDILNASGFGINPEIQDIKLPPEAKELIDLIAATPPNLVKPVIKVCVIMAKQIIADYPNFDPDKMDDEKPHL